MSYEFKKLSDVDIVETPSETANVLIEEDGVIKKAPKTAVGGGGSSNEYDMIIQVKLTDGTAYFDVPSSQYKIISTIGYDKILNKIEQGYMPNVSLSYLTQEDWGNIYEFAQFLGGVYISNDREYIELTQFDIPNYSAYLSLRIDKNNTIQVGWPPM